MVSTCLHAEYIECDFLQCRTFTPWLLPDGDRAAPGCTLTARNTTAHAYRTLHWTYNISKAPLNLRKFQKLKYEVVLN